MIKTFTQNDLIRYIYHETSEKEDLEISKALLTDSELRALYVSLSAVKAQVDTTQLEPSPNTVLNILSYSRNVEQPKP